MKRKPSFMFAGAIAFTTCLASAIAITATTNPAQAEAPNFSDKLTDLHINLTSPSIAQGSLPPVVGPSIRQLPELAGINLTPQQEALILQIQQKMQPQFEGIFPHPPLALDQQNQFKSGQPIQIELPPPTPEQQAKLQQVMQSYFSQVEAVLTPEQQQQFRRNREKIGQDTFFIRRAK